MDHWGDPWADNNADNKSPKKNEVASPLPPRHAPAPVLLNGFLDDAGWGNEDDGFGEWATSSTTNATNLTDTLQSDSSAIESHKATSDDARWDKDGESDNIVPFSGDNWPGVTRDETEDVDNVLSETSDSSTTIQPPDAPAQAQADGPDSLQPDDSSSTRLSISPSETSRSSAPVESPRTSVEEDRGIAGLSAGVKNDKIVETGDKLQEDEAVVTGLDDVDVDDDLGNFSEGTSSKEETPSNANITKYLSSSASEEFEVAKDESDKLPRESSRNSDAAVGTHTFAFDPKLLDSLFPSLEANKELGEAPNDPIYSTTGRKAWYRLTRKQTLREFNNGTSDDNHIRVTWAKSHVRSEVNKIVGRWAREDRLSGTGPGARASFYWDTPAPVAVKTITSHSRTQSSIPAPRVTAPIRQSLPSLSTNTPAAFNWSSPSVAIDPWAQDNLGTQPMTSPITRKHRAVEKIRNPHERTMSHDSTSQEMRPRPSVPLPETLTVANMVSPPISTAHITTPDPWEKLSSLSHNASVKEDRVIAPIDDDDDWGEMVSSPTVSTPTATVTMSQMTTRNNTLSTPSSTPGSVKAVPGQENSNDTMHSAPIVRLQSMISPTSAIFGAKSFVPKSIEQGPVGPSMLKPVNRAVAPITASKSDAKISAEEMQDQKTSQDGSPEQASARESINSTPASNRLDDHNKSAFTSSNVSEPARSFTPSPTPAPAVQTITDPWADADFSFFESALPSTVAAPSQAKHGPSDPFSVFESPPRSTSAASSAKTFTRSPPRNLPAPHIQPLTGATNSAQQRKAEEEDIIKRILIGLPNLSYMLR